MSEKLGSAAVIDDFGVLAPCWRPSPRGEPAAEPTFLFRVERSVNALYFIQKE